VRARERERERACVQGYQHIFVFKNGWATSWTISVLGFDSRRRLGIFLFTTVSRTVLRPTQPPIQWVPGVLSLEVKRPGREADQSPQSSAEVKECVELYLHSLNTPFGRRARLKKSPGLIRAPEDRPVLSAKRMPNDKQTSNCLAYNQNLVMNSGGA
jgi:hypothetical protein